MNILITGSNGFLGGATYKFLSHKHNVFPLTRRHLYSLSPILLSKTTKLVKPNALIHFAWIGASNSNDLNNPAQIDNISKSIELFNFGLLAGVKHFYFISTSWVYGNYDKICKEEDICYSKNLYGFSKLKVEEIWKELCKLHNCKLTILRPFWIYGKNDKENRFVPTLINKCLKNESIELNPCTHEVNYLNIEDFCSAVGILIDKQSEGIFNICNVSSMMVKKIVQRIKYLTKSDSNITYDKEYNKDFIHFWDGSNEKLLNLGWIPKIDIDEGLTKTIEWTKQKLS